MTIAPFLAGLRALHAVAEHANLHFIDNMCRAQCLNYSGTVMVEMALPLPTSTSSMSVGVRIEPLLRLLQKSDTDTTTLTPISTGLSITTTSGHFLLEAVDLDTDTRVVPPRRGAVVHVPHSFVAHMRSMCTVADVIVISWHSATQTLQVATDAHDGDSSGCTTVRATGSAAHNHSVHVASMSIQPLLYTLSSPCDTVVHIFTDYLEIATPTLTIFVAATHR